MGTHPSAEIESTFNWESNGYERYIAGYRLYKQLKKKWGASEKEASSDAIQ
ncbi:MAG: hypothetical protein ACQEV0_09860 [Bacillota bacterium]